MYFFGGKSNLCCFNFLVLFRTCSEHVPCAFHVLFHGRPTKIHGTFGVWKLIPVFRVKFYTKSARSAGKFLGILLLKMKGNIRGKYRKGLGGYEKRHDRSRGGGVGGSEQNFGSRN